MKFVKNSTRIVIAGIYQITCRGRHYIGSSKNVWERLYDHRSELRGNNHANSILQNHWNKYGEESFSVEIIEQCSLKLLKPREQHWIDKLNPYMNVIKEVTRSISIPKRVREAISKSLKKGYKSGKILAKGRSVYVYDLLGNFIANFETVTDCCAIMNIGQSSVGRVLRKQQKQIQGLQIIYKGEAAPKKLPTTAKGFLRAARHIRPRAYPIVDLNTNIQYPSKRVCSEETGISRSTLTYYFNIAKKNYTKNGFNLMPLNSVNSRKNWKQSILSQALQECDEGATTRLWNPQKDGKNPRAQNIKKNLMKK